jgi:hypothetical protein
VLESEIAAEQAEREARTAARICRRLELLKDPQILLFCAIYFADLN